MFIDEATIRVEGGNGGNGCYAYERQRGKPRGKPVGGTGGRGGHIYLRGSSQLHTLQDVSFRKLYRAERGQHGRGANWTGRMGKDIVIDVPLGTVVRDAVTGRQICDCTEHDRRYRVAKGGRGGKGNAALATRKNPAPQYVQPGGVGEKQELRLTLKVLADVGLVGRPNAGKSTFLSRVSKARPAIADYPFTTTRPHLGIVALPDSYDTMVIADIPGLIEDSHKGKGLGIQFLKHIERTRILAVMVESSAEDPEAEAAVLIRELKAYSPILAEKPTCMVLTKTDLCDTPPSLPDHWYAISSVTGDGIQGLLRHLKGLYEELGEEVS